MRKSLVILEALNKIDDSLLIDSFDNSYINTNNINFRNQSIKFKYLLAPAILAITILSVIIYNNIEIGKNKYLARNDNESITNNIINDNIVFNAYTITSRDFDGKSVKADVLSRFDFLKNLYIPNGYNKFGEYEIYEKENINDDKYSKLWQYELLYTKNNVLSDIIEISFTKEDYILLCIMPNLTDFTVSVINGSDVYLFRSLDGNKFQAIFEYNGFKIYIDASNTSENEFLSVIKSIII
ncbi:MAG: hypothetical protein IJ809_00095 [Clostridia bacterium]|nr:hypothetical protein [Clostridia bacterium]